MAGYSLIDPQRFFDVLGAEGKIRGVTSAKLDKFGYGQFANGVRHTIAMWAPNTPRAALNAGEVRPEQTIHVRIIPENQKQDAYFMARVADEKATHVQCTSLAGISEIKADDYFAYHSPRFNQYGFVARYNNYVFLYYISVRPEAQESNEQFATSRIQEFDSHVFTVLRDAI